MSEKQIVGIGKLFQHGKCQIPKEVRAALFLKDGDRIYFVQEENGIVLEKAPPIRKRELMGKYVVRS